MLAIYTSSVVVAVISSKSSGMTASAYHFTRSVSIAESSSGHRQRKAPFRSRQVRWPICSKGSTGEIHS